MELSLSRQLAVLVEQLLCIVATNNNWISLSNLLLNSPVSYVVGINVLVCYKYLANLSKKLIFCESCNCFEFDGSLNKTKEYCK